MSIKHKNWKPVKGHSQWGMPRAKRAKLILVEPEQDELQIDIDGCRALRHYGAQFAILQKAGITHGWKESMTPSRAKNHMHITIKLPRVITNLERVCLQSILGSDPMREAFNYVRVNKRTRYPIVFFEKENT